jgi:signal transduction histidine kinase
MIHTAWTARDGAPQSINTLAQTPDGTLWLGTRDGLYSFDGITFSVFQPVSGSLPRKNVNYLFVAKDGSLWVFGGTIQPTRIRDGAAMTFNHVEDRTFPSLTGVQQSTDGTMWATLNSRELVRLGADDAWHVVAGPKPNSNILGPLFIDSSDTQWLIADDMLYRRFRGEETFASTGIPVYECFGFKEGQDHSIWIVSSGPSGFKPARPVGQPPIVGLMHVDRLGKRLPNPGTHDDVNALVAADDGSVWLSHGESGLQRLRAWEMNSNPPKGNAYPPDLFDAKDGLTTTGFRALLRDHDGNIWVAGGRGLDRFQRAIMVPAVKNAIGGWWSVCASPKGDVWLAVMDGYRAVLRGSRLTRLKDRENTSSILCSKDGTVLLLEADSGIAEIRNGHIDRLPLLPAHGRYWERYKFSSVVVLPDHQLIASTIGSAENRIWTCQHGTWKVFPPTASITRVRAMMLDRDDNLYLGSQDTVILLRAPGFAQQSWARVPIGAIEGFSETRFGTFAFGENGIALEGKNGFRMLAFSDPGLATSVTGLVEDREGNIWINGSRAIARIASSEIAAAISDQSHHIVASQFQEGDYKGSDIFAYSRNSAQIDPQGRLWFPTANGAITIDPHNVDRLSRPPTLSIRSITADGRRLPASGSFPPRIETLDVSYFGLNLSNPAGVVYRYMLEGSDTGWQNVGTRAEAVYTHLRPGSYIFHVEASNGDGIWTPPFNSAPFRILPAFYQTFWFEGLCVVAFMLLLWLGLTARLKFVASGIRQRAEERADERIRIARELHDTLLQGIQGLLLSFHAAASKVSGDHESKKALERALALADRVILDGRDRVNLLRSEHLTNGELEPSIETIADDLTGLSKIDFALERTGKRQALNPEFVDEVYYIVREALINSFRHSGASQITVSLDYGEQQFSIVCRDNGRGFDTYEVQESTARGHWGLRGMAERAEKIGANFDYESAPGEGVKIRLVLPASQAYIRAFGFKAIFNRCNWN